MFPIALATSKTLDVSLLPFAVTIMIAASASFSTPMGYQTNLLVMSAGNYRFKDFAGLGIPLILLAMVASLIVLPLLWPLQ